MKKILIMSLVAMAVVGCKKEVTCSGEETQTLVKNTFMDSVQSELKSDKTISEDKREKIFNWLESNTVFSIENIQTIMNNKDTGAQQCKADFSISIESTVPNSIYSLIKSDKEKLVLLVNEIAPLDNVKYDNQKFTKTIEYSTRMTDDNKKQMLELSGTNKFATLVPVLVMFNLTPIQENDGNSSSALNVYSQYKYKEHGYSGEIKITKVSACKVHSELGCSTREVLEAEISTVNDSSLHMCDFTVYENDYARVADGNLLTTSFNEIIDPDNSDNDKSQSPILAKFSGKILVIDGDSDGRCGMGAVFSGKYVATGEKIKLD